MILSSRERSRELKIMKERRLYRGRSIMDWRLDPAKAEKTHAAYYRQWSRAHQRELELEELAFKDPALVDSGLWKVAMSSAREEMSAAESAARRPTSSLGTAA